jgi:tetratricopeptide (TPR) repeat protein
LAIAAHCIVPTSSFAQSEQVTCPEPVRNGRADYRDRSTPQQRWIIDDNMWAHLNPAKARMREGEYSQRVMADINWTLVRFPNHYVALEMLVTYALNGGKPHQYQVPECYFRWAKEYVPNDAKVLLAEGYYYWHMKDLERAVETYEAVFAIEPDSISAHYNLGLLRIELKDFDKAQKHASIAYGYGYPLPGLRDKLKAAGYDVPPLPPESETANAKPAAETAATQAH